MTLDPKKVPAVAANVSEDVTWGQIMQPKKYESNMGSCPSFFFGIEHKEYLETTM